MSKMKQKESNMRKMKQKVVIVLSRLGGTAVGVAKMMLVGLVGFGTLTSEATDRYVSSSGTNDIGNGYNTWNGAATAIQPAIDVCADGDVVWVEDGFVCNTGGVTNWPAGTILTNRIAITKAITVRSVNDDPTNTKILGAWDTNTTCGATSVRCVYMADNAKLIGFTLADGSTMRTNESAVTYDGYGGGIYAVNSSAIISNCVITGNAATRGGGGAYRGTYYSTEVSNNSTLDDMKYPNGAGLLSGTAYNCKIIHNRGKTSEGTSGGCGGGGAFGSTLYNCLVIGNEAAFGGGVSGVNTFNCTIVGNKSYTWGSGAFQGTHYNTIIYSNSPNNAKTPGDGITFYNSCTTPAFDGWEDGNITNNPAFVNWGSGYGVSLVEGDYRLTSVSPCIDAGMNGSWTTSGASAVDLDGNPRIVGTTVDMGAYELPPPLGTVIIIK